MSAQLTAHRNPLSASLAMNLATPAAWAVLVQLQPLGIVAAILGGRVRPLAALSARQVNDGPIFFLSHQMSLAV
jgi:hypothetical protein